MKDTSPARIPPELRERYRMVRPLGRGGMGVVIEVEDRTLGRNVALKLSSLAPGNELQARFLREAKVAARLRHPHVIEVYDAGIAGGVPYLTMELVEGNSLDELPRPADPGPIFRAVAEALEAIHAAGVVHRDVKPGNILIADERVLLTDFGLVHDPDVTKLTRTGTLAGTLAYMAPEVLQGKGITPAADWWSLGVTLFEVMERRMPYQVQEVMQFGRGRVPPVPAIRSVPEDSALARMVHGWMAKDPAARPASVVAMRAYLEDGPLADPALPAPSRRPGLPAALGLVAGMAVMTAAVTLRPGGAAPPAAPAPAASTAPAAHPAISAALAALDDPAVQDELLDLDPWRWGEALSAQPALRALIPLLANPAATPELEEVDARLVAMGLPALAAPHRLHRPSPSPFADAGLPRRDRMDVIRPHWPRAHGGHLARAAEAFAQLDQHFLLIDDDIDALEVGEPTSEAFPFTDLPSPIIGVGGWDLVLGRLDTSVEARMQAHRWWTPAFDAYRETMAALGASLREEPETRPAAAVTGALVTARIQRIYPSWLLVLDPDWMLGHHPVTPEGQALRAAVLGRQARSAMLGRRKPPGLVEAARQASIEGLRTAGNGPLPTWVRAIALEARARASLTLGEDPDLGAEAARQLPGILERLPTRVVGEVLQALAKVAHEHPTRRPFDATTARQALTYLEDHPEAWQNLVTHRRERGLGLLRRLSTGPGSP